MEPVHGITAGGIGIETGYAASSMVCPRSWESAEATATAGKKGKTGSFVMRFGVGEDPDLSGKRHLLIVWPGRRCWCHPKCDSAPVLVAFSATSPAMCEFPAVVLSDGEHVQCGFGDSHQLSLWVTAGRVSVGH